MYLAVDPGETTGWCTFDYKGDVTGSGEIKGEDPFVDFLEALQPVPTVIVYEGFQLYGHKAKAQIGSKFRTVQIIGILKAYARTHKSTVDIQLFEQPASILPIAQKWTQVEVPASGRPNHDWTSAYNHGMYWLIKAGVARSFLDRSRNAST